MATQGQVDRWLVAFCANAPTIYANALRLIIGGIAQVISTLYYDYTRSALFALVAIRSCESVIPTHPPASARRDTFYSGNGLLPVLHMRI